MTRKNSISTHIQTTESNDDWDIHQSVPDTVPTQFIQNQDESSIAFPFKHDPAYFPAITARTSLFCVNRISRDDNPDEMKNPVKVELSGQNGYKLTAWGPRLNMHDKLVWETAVQIAFENKHGFGNKFAISLRDFAQRMGWKNTGAKSLRWIWNSLRRLYHIRLDFEMPNGAKGGGSILSTAIQDENGNFTLRLNPDFCAPIFFNDNRFLIKVLRRNQLVNQLSKWLHDYLSTHKGFEVPHEDINPGRKSSEMPTQREMTLSLLNIRALCGYAGTRHQFLTELGSAMNELQKSAPELIAGHELIREGRSSDTWKLRIVRGNERPVFLMPELSRIEKNLNHIEVKATSRPTRRGRGGVAL